MTESVSLRLPHLTKEIADELKEHDRLIATQPQSKASFAVIYDPCESIESNGTNHPEERQHVILQALLNHFPLIAAHINHTPSSDAELSRLHDPRYVSFLQNAFADAERWADKDWFSKKCGLVPYNIHPYPVTDRLLAYNPIYKQAGLFAKDVMSPIRKFTFHNAACSAQNSIIGASMLYQNAFKLIYALNSSPGHHASFDRYAGYCYFNNAALAAQQLLDLGAKRVAILDLDYHMGCATQALFYKRSDVFTVSIHINPSFDYPSYSGFTDEVGEDAGTGYNLNLILPPKADWIMYSAQLTKALAAIKDKDVTHLIVAFGGDTSESDPDCSNTAGMLLQLNDYIHMGQQITTALPNMSILITQEGGYAMNLIDQITCNFIQGLLSTTIITM